MQTTPSKQADLTQERQFKGPKRGKGGGGWVGLPFKGMGHF